MNDPTPGPVLFHHPGRAPLVFRDPQRVLMAATAAEVPHVLAEAERAARAGAWAAGYVSYEAAPAFDGAFRVRAGARMPLAWFALFDAPGPPPDAAAPDAEPGAAAPRPLDWEPDTGAAEHAHVVAAIRAAIAAGDVYQVNHTLRMHARAVGDDLARYAALRAAQPGAYAAFLDLGDFRILSASPELFFRRRGGHIETRPMKGTRPRGRWAEEDASLASELAGSEKDRAENLMIVDLLRNDLGRIARTGSVRVPQLFAIERYATVWQMTSTITAELPDSCTLPDIFAALFPCGSVTGAPKIAAMRFIAAHERAPREVYCGAIGLLEPGGDCTFSVAIRTAWHDVPRERLEYGAGGGITWDSDAGGEWREVLAKAAILHHRRPAFRLIETLRTEQGAPVRLELHLDRLTASAEYFGFAFDRARVVTALEAAASRTAARLRLRLLLAADGALEVEAQPLEELRGPLPVTLAAEPVDARDPFLFHKTTNRAVYEARLAAHPGAFDVLLRNQEGALTEFTRGNLVLELAGRRVTPPRTCGLLAGVLRRTLLEAGALAEQVLTAEDLRRAERAWLINSVREWLEVRFAG